MAMGRRPEAVRKTASESASKDSDEAAEEAEESSSAKATSRGLPEGIWDRRIPTAFSAKKLSRKMTAPTMPIRRFRDTFGPSSTIGLKRKR